MSQSFNCKCSERKKPVGERNWLCTQYRWNSGAFVVPGGEPSDYSQVWCLTCGGQGRTKAAYVDKIPMDTGTSGLQTVQNALPGCRT